MNSIGNSIFINQNTPAVSNLVSSTYNSITVQSAIASKITEDKKRLIQKVKDTSKSNAMDPKKEHEKEKEREYQFSTEEYERVFMHENHLPTQSKADRLNTVNSDQVSKYEEVQNNETSCTKDIEA